MIFDNALSQWAELTTWSGTTPCLIRPDSCSSGASVTVWIKMAADCPNWSGIFGSRGNGGTGDGTTDGLAVACDGAGTGLK